MNFGKTLFNDGWKFRLTSIDTDYETAMNGDWHDVEIPHDWLIGDTRNLYKTGEGWYTKKFELTADDVKELVSICFDGVYMNTTVFVNGKTAGEWKYGYSAFSFDISTLVTKGINTVTVCVKHEAPNTRWYSGAGIFRDVFLQKKKHLRIAENGIYISAGNTEGITFVETEIKSDLIGTHNIEIIHTVIDADGKPSLSGSEFYSISGGETVYDAQHMTLTNAKIWSVEQPYLYTLKTQMLENGEVVETRFTRYGYRKTEFTPDKGFFLNDKPLKLHGVCMHHDLGAFGAAVNYSALKRQIAKLKSMGVNSIRTSHNMPASVFMDLCDEMGILVDSESFDMWELSKTEKDYARFFPEWFEKDVTSWIRRDRNHPSVIMWSVGNEIYDTHKSERGVEVVKMLKECVWKNDPHENAAATIGSNYMRWENAQKVADELKYAGYNYTEDMYDQHHKNYPDWFMYGSETASTVRSRGIYHFPADMPLLTHDDMQCSDMGNSVVGWGRSHESSWIEDRNREFIGGQYIWTGFDYIGEPTPYSTKNSYFGIIDTAGLPKDAYYFFKAVWTDGKAEPFIHLFPYWDWNDGQIIDIYTYSNVENVELFLNGKSLGRQHIDLLHGDILHGAWKAAYKKGELVAKAYDSDGNVVATDRRASFGEAAVLTAEPDKTELKADGRDAAFIEIGVTDIYGEPVANARNRIKVEVFGAARLVGTDNGDSTDYDSYKGDNRRLFSGKMIAIVESTLESGEVTIKITSDGLAPKEIKLSAVQCEKPVGISTVDGYYPVYVQDKKDEIPVRKLELSSAVSVFTEKNPQADISVRILPENATYDDIICKCVSDNGIETNIAAAEVVGGKTIRVNALGDGNFRLRAMCANGGTVPQVVSDLEFSVTGLGEATQSAYKFVSASLYSFRNVPLNVVERGAVSGITQRSVIGFKNIDFGRFGSDTVRIYIGNSENSPVSVEMWLNDPSDGGEKLATFDFPFNGLWDRFAPTEFVLPKRLCGVNKLAFVISQRCIFGGFDFIQKNKAYEKINASDNDSVYGDDYTIAGDCIENIGNNVFITFDDFDFTNGATKITVCGKTPNEQNTMHIKCKNTNGESKTQIIEFPNSDEYIEKTFELEKIEGKQGISLVFLPGSNFGLKWFRFGE